MNIGRSGLSLSLGSVLAWWLSRSFLTISVAYSLGLVIVPKARFGNVVGFQYRQNSASSKTGQARVFLSFPRRQLLLDNSSVVSSQEAGFPISFRGRGDPASAPYP